MTQFLTKLNKKVAARLRSPKSIILFILVLSTIIHLLSPNTTIDNFKISFNSLFSGLLALIGFVFAARTFITFKLYETVYGTTKYQEKIKKLTKEGAYNKSTLTPLRTLDNSLSTTTALSLLSLFLLTLISLIDPPKIIATKNTLEIIANTTLGMGTAFKELMSQTVFPVCYKIFSDMVCSVILVTFIQLCYNLRSLNINIKSIIDTWQKEADDNPTNQLT